MGNLSLSNPSEKRAHLDEASSITYMRQEQLTDALRSASSGQGAVGLEANPKYQGGAESFLKRLSAQEVRLVQDVKCLDPNVQAYLRNVLTTLKQ